MKHLLILASVLLLCSCTQKKEETKDYKPAQKEQTEVITQTNGRIKFVELNEIDDIDEIRDRLKEAYDKIEELEQKVQNAQSSIDEARSKINMTLMLIEDARSIHDRTLLDEAEDELDDANTELDDAEAELW